MRTLLDDGMRFDQADRKFENSTSWIDTTFCLHERTSRNILWQAERVADEAALFTRTHGLLHLRPGRSIGNRRIRKPRVSKSAGV